LKIVVKRKRNKKYNIEYHAWNKHSHRREITQIAKGTLIIDHNRSDWIKNLKRNKMKATIKNISL